MSLVGVFGGTFDPVHCGHLRTVLELKTALGLDEVLVIPCGQPPHRPPPVASANARLQMLAAALADLDGMRVDARELSRDGPSYTVDTLDSLKKESPGATLCLLLGSDAFAGLESWHRWQDLSALCHIVVARRPGITRAVPAGLQALVSAAEGTSEVLRQQSAGRIVFCETSQLDVSSSHLRAQAAAGLSLRWLVPENVERLIEEYAWYRPKT